MSKPRRETWNRPFAKPSEGTNLANTLILKINFFFVLQFMAALANTSHKPQIGNTMCP